MIPKKKPKPKKASKQKRRFDRVKPKPVSKRLTSDCIEVIMTGEQVVVLEDACDRYRRKMISDQMIYNEVSYLMNVLRWSIEEKNMVISDIGIGSKSGIVKINFSGRMLRLLEKVSSYVVANNIIIKVALTKIAKKLTTTVNALNKQESSPR
jgi:hypothetical protein